MVRWKFVDKETGVTETANSLDQLQSLVGKTITAKSQEPRINYPEVSTLNPDSTSPTAEQKLTRRLEQNAEHERELLGFQESYEQLERENERLGGGAYKRLQEEGRAMLSSMEGLRRENAELKQKLETSLAQSANTAGVEGEATLSDDQPPAKRKRRGKRSHTDYEAPPIPRRRDDVV